jgi:hypothetical protein
MVGMRSPGFLAATRQDALNTGLQGSGLEARGLILHGMWMQPQWEGSASFDSAQRAAIATGQIVPHRRTGHERAPPWPRGVGDSERRGDA